MGFLIFAHAGSFTRLLDNPPAREGVLLGILGGGMPLGFPNPDPISDQKMSFSTPVFRPGGGQKKATLHVYVKQKLCHHC